MVRLRRFRFIFKDFWDYFQIFKADEHPREAISSIEIVKIRA